MKLKTLAFLSLIAFLALFAPAALAQTFSVIHNFTGTGGDGALPWAGLTLHNGLLYGTTLRGGSGGGTVFTVTHSGANWGITPLYFFTTGGNTPVGRPSFGPNGVLYGTVEQGAGGYGGDYYVVPPAIPCKTLTGCMWRENIIASFGNDSPFGDLTFDPDGNIYGTTVGAGFGHVGTVYQLVRSMGWKENLLYSFSGPDGAYPQSGVIFDANGNLFGTAPEGGTNNDGTIFELKYNGVGWTQSVIYNFLDAADGKYPSGALISDGAGNFYGATSSGGVNGGGTVFELSPSGDSWTLQVLYSLSGYKFNQCGPLGALAMDAAGNLYGTTNCDGANSLGNIFKLTNTGQGWEYTSLHDFNGSDGSNATSNVTISADGTLFGTASQGGSTFNSSCFGYDGCGVVWMIEP